MFGIGIPELLIMMVLLLIIPIIFYLIALQKALSRCSTKNRAMSPALVWLLLIPIFNLFWHFFIVVKVAKSLQNEFRSRSIAFKSPPGQNIGLAMCILSVLSFIPYVGFLCSIAALVCWIIYWIKIAGFSSQIRV